MSSTVKGLLQKINFIEKDMELHKQILFSIDGDDRNQIEAVVAKIAGFKAQIEDLRQKINEIDADEYNRIIRIETGSQVFKSLSEDKQFEEVITLNETGQCGLKLADETTLDCLVAAREASGDWSVLTVEGEVMEYRADQVKAPL